MFLIIFPDANVCLALWRPRGADRGNTDLAQSIARKQCLFFPCCLFSFFFQLDVNTIKASRCSCSAAVQQFFLASVEVLRYQGGKKKQHENFQHEISSKRRKNLAGDPPAPNNINTMIIFILCMVFRVSGCKCVPCYFLCVRPPAPRSSVRRRRGGGGHRGRTGALKLYNILQEENISISFQSAKAGRGCVREHVDHEQVSGFSLIISNSNQTLAKEGKLRVHWSFLFSFQH